MMHIRDMPPPLPPDVPPGARAVIDATLVKDPRRRYGSGGEFAAAVAAVRAGRPLPTPSGMALAAAHTGSHTRIVTGGMPQPRMPGTGSFPMPPRPPRRRAGRAWLWALLALILVALVVLGIWAIPKLTGSGTPATGTPAPVTSGATPGKAGVSFPGDSPTYGEPSGQGRLGPVQVKPGDLLGHPADYVVEQLRKSGLEPDVRSRPNGAAQDLRTCLVTSVQPIGTLDQGSKVTVECTPSG
jgi:eukaryotic-like serine/threonine-protein kinase